MRDDRFHIALLVNPIAGLGGPSGLKGSDAPETAARAHELGVESRIPGRLSAILSALLPFSDRVRFTTVSGSMGQDYFQDFPDFDLESVFSVTAPTSARDTHDAVVALEKFDPDLLLFAGGDGTARDVCAALSKERLCLGIPSGVKMHSGVFAVTPAAVVSIIQSMLDRKLVAAMHGEVRDIDERSFQKGQVLTRHFGELLVPDDQLLVQSVKCSGLPDDDIALNEIAAFVTETSEDYGPETLILLGSGGSLRHLKESLGIETPTLLGVDAWSNGEVVGLDLNEPEIFSLMEQFQQAKLYLSVIGGQGIILGRGNQQLSPRNLIKIGIENIQLVGTQQRLLGLAGKALRVDSGDASLDHALSGFRKVLCGYDDYVLYEVSDQV